MKIPRPAELAGPIRSGGARRADSRAGLPRGTVPTTVALALVLAAFAVGYASLPPGSEPTVTEPLPPEGFEWVRALNGPVSGESGDDMVVDEDGTLYIAGHHGGLDFDRDGTIDLPAAGIDPLFIKGLPNGHIDWIRAPSGPRFDSWARIALDRHGGAYVTGSFRETLAVQPGVTLHGDGETDGYLVRYGAAGDALWTRAILGTGPETFRDVASDPAGNAYAAGWSRGTFRLDGHPGEFRTLGEDAALIVSYDPDGTLRWVRAATGAASWSISRIEVGPRGDIVVAGTYGENGADFDGDGEAELPGRTGRTTYIARFDADDGAFLGAWPIAAATVLGITFAGDGDLVLTGSLAGPADFDGDGAPDADVTGGGERSAFLARYGREGELRWARAYGMDVAWHVATDGGRFALSGFYDGERDIDGDGEAELHHADDERDSDLAILLVTAEGRPERAWTAPGPGNDQARAAAFVPGEPLLYVTGFIQLTADFSGDGVNNEGWVECDALGDFIIARYRVGEPASGACEIALEARRVERSFDVRLTWSGVTAERVDIRRDGVLITTTANDGAYTDTVERGGSRLYEISETGARACSDTARVVF